MEKLGIEQLPEMARQVRRDALRMVHAAASGHPGGALSCADYLTLLYFHEMEYTANPFRKDGQNEDCLFLSNGHVSAAWYSVLARSGHFPVGELSEFRRLGSRLQGHPTPAADLPGVRVASGSLGQGLSVGCGMALAKMLAHDEHFIFTLHGDGELQEGQIWEAALFAAARKLDNLIAAVDYNKIQIDGPTDAVVPLGELGEKWKSFGWNVFEVPGHDFAAMHDAIAAAKARRGSGKPSVLLLHTKIGSGVDFMENQSSWHGKAPNDEQLQEALSQLPPTRYGDF